MIFIGFFLKRYSLKTEIDAGFECSKGPSAGPVCSEMLPERASDPESSVLRPSAIEFSFLLLREASLPVRREAFLNPMPISAVEVIGMSGR
jgi:hypothetical protein